MRALSLFLLFVFLLGCNKNTGNFITYTLQANGTPEQAKKAYKAVLARLEQFDIGSDEIESRFEGNRIYLKFPENKFIQQNPNRLRKLLQHQGLFSMNEVYMNFEIYSKLFSHNDTHELAKAFNQRLFQIMLPEIAPNNNNNNVQPGPVIGYVKDTDTVLLGTMLRDTLPEFVSLYNTKFMFTPHQNSICAVVAINTNSLKSIQPEVESVELNVNDESGKYYMISIKFSPAYSSLWAKMTRSTIGKSIAMIVDGQLYSYPTVNSEITTGNSVISGEFDTETAENLANLIRNGYPCPVNIIEEGRTKSAH